jgi:hypothetical protein
MELSWINKIRIAVSMALGVVFIGFLAWPLAAPFDPLNPVLVSNFTVGSIIILFGLSFVVGFVAYFLSWPYGREIGVLAVPSGLAVWAIRSSSMASLMQTAPDITHRYELYKALMFEPFFWLLVVVLGHIGVLLAYKIRPATANIATQTKPKFGLNLFFIVGIAIVVSTVVAQICIRVFAREATTFVESLVAQPSTGQIVFAVLASFTIVGFLAKKFLNTGYICTTISASILSVFLIAYYEIHSSSAQMVYYPAAFFPNVIISILPIQMIAFGTIGSISGYWLAVRYDYWRKHES